MGNSIGSRCLARYCLADARDNSMAADGGVRNGDDRADECGEQRADVEEDAVDEQADAGLWPKVAVDKNAGSDANDGGDRISRFESELNIKQKSDNTLKGSGAKRERTREGDRSRSSDHLESLVIGELRNALHTLWVRWTTNVRAKREVDVRICRLRVCI